MRKPASSRDIPDLPTQSHDQDKSGNRSHKIRRATNTSGHYGHPALRKGPLLPDCFKLQHNWIPDKVIPEGQPGGPRRMESKCVLTEVLKTELQVRDTEDEKKPCGTWLI